jgi:hypothetical protein
MSKMWSSNLKDLFVKLFNKNPEDRLKFIPSIKQHPWFNGLDWDKII